MRLDQSFDEVVQVQVREVPGYPSEVVVMMVRDGVRASTEHLHPEV